jgi:hypothetical protein
LCAVAVRSELAAHRLVVGDGIAFDRGDVDEVDQHRAALDVGEELVAETGPRRGAFDQARDVGDDRLAILSLDRPQDRRERRERVVGDFRCRPRQPPEQRGLACIREADQADVGEKFQAQLDPVGFGPGPFLGEARCLPGRAGETTVPVPAATAARHHGSLPCRDEINRAAVNGRRLSAGRHRNLQVFPSGPLPVRPFPMPPPLRPKVLTPP